MMLMAPIDHSLQHLPEHECAQRTFEAAQERKQAALARAAEQRAAQQALQGFERVAMLARQCLAKMEQRSAAVRENGGTMPIDFWHAFADAVKTVRLAERDVCLAREKVR